MTSKIIAIILFAFGCRSILATYKLQEHFEWNILDYEYPTEKARIQALKTGRLIPENSLPVGMELWRDKVFVSVPRWRPGTEYKIKNYI